jgi:nucleotide-binding universal stress UspA family protein
MKDQILVPLDGSELAESILPNALSVAHITGSSLVLLHAMPSLSVAETMTGMFPVTPSVWESWEEEAKLAQDYVVSIAKRLTKTGLTVQTEVVEGEAAKVIVNYAKDHPSVRMIAMATHGRSGLGRLILGSVADRVLHTSPAPVLLVRTKGQSHADQLELAGSAPAPYKKILVPLDSSLLAEQALEHAVSLAKTEDTTLLLVTVLPNPQERIGLSDDYAPLWLEEVQKSETNRLRDYILSVAQKLRRRGLKAQTETPTGNPAAAVLRTAMKQQVDLIVMTTHGRSGFERLWLGSVATNIVHQSNCPILLVRVTEQVPQQQPDRQLAPEQPNLEQGIAH